MEEEKQVANEEVTENTTVESTQQENPEVTTSEVSADAKQDSVDNSSQDLHKHPRFRELTEQKNRYKQKYEEMLYNQQMREKQGKPPIEENDPYAGLDPESAKQTREFINKYVLPEMERRFSPFIQEVQNEKLNKQVNEAKQLCSDVGIDFDERLPEIVDYLQRPENRNRLTAKEAVINLYFNDIRDSIRNTSLEEFQKQKEELNAKKKTANLQNQTIPQGAVIHSDEMRRSKLSANEKLAEDIRAAIELGKQGVKNAKVKSS